MSVSIIVASAHNGVIGKEGSLPWYLPAELAYFKEKTMGHPIIMGRKTHESIGRTLPGRKNIVITRNPGYRASEGSLLAASLKKALQETEGEEAFVIGGESVFAEALPLADKIYLTRVDADIKGDRFFNFDTAGWRQIFSEKHTKDEKNPYDFEFTVWERKK